MGLGTLDEARLAALLEAGRGLVAQLEVDAVLEELLRVACELTSARYAAIGVLDDDRRELRRFVTRGVDPAERERIGDPPRGHGILGELIGIRRRCGSTTSATTRAPTGSPRTTRRCTLSSACRC